jgi:hypothetical protein
MILTMQQRSPEWFAARLGIATASRFGDVMATIKTGEAATRRNYRFELVIERLTGVAQETFQSKAMREGIEREPAAKVAVEERFSTLIEEVGFIRHPTLETGGSPDGFLGKDGGLEIKCPVPATHATYMALKSGECPSDYYWQVMGGMWLSDRRWWLFASYCPEYPPAQRLIVRRVMRNETAIAELAAGVASFMEGVRDAEATAAAYQDPDCSLPLT